MKKKIYVDGYFLAQKVTGVQRYAREFIENMISNGYSVVILAPVNASDNIPGAKTIKSIFFKGLFWQQLILPFLLITRGFPPLLSLTGIGPVLYPNKALAIHDASIYRFPTFFSKGYLLFYRTLYPLSIFFSKALITVSEFSKNELQSFINVNKKTFVVYNVASILNVSEGPANVGSVPDGKFILAVGSLDERKNLTSIIKAFHESSLNGEYQLVVAGGSSSSFKSFNADKSYRNVHFTGYVTDETLAALYQKACFFAYLSVYEGFGIPPLEALTYRCPVLLSDIPAFREIYGDNFYYVDPKNIMDIRKGMEEFSKLDRDKLQSKQRDVIGKFSKKNQLLQINIALNGAFGE